MTAAGAIDPVIAHEKVFIKLSLPQRSMHRGGWLFHHQLSAGAMKVPRWQEESRHIVDGATLCARSSASPKYHCSKEIPPCGEVSCTLILTGTLQSAEEEVRRRREGRPIQLAGL
jgi:hypothetical protein